MRTGCSREPPSRPHFSLLRESRSQNSQIRAVFVGFSLVSASFESAGLVAARASSRKGPVSGLRDVTFSGCGGNRHDGDPVIARRPRWRGAVAKRLGVVPHRECDSRSTIRRYLHFEGLIRRPRNIYLRFEGVTRTLWNIYLHFEGLVAEYQWHGSRMIPVASIMQYLEYRATPTP